ncbi:hypothetical protein JDM1_1010 [Lactiplantibacillus plantarum JDM1]|nr:hypothetical protein JDM1_1010 [Lactiplantibacillus plantarum JDM1]
MKNSQNKIKIINMGIVSLPLLRVKDKQ